MHYAFQYPGDRSVRMVKLIFFGMAFKYAGLFRLAKYILITRVKIDQVSGHCFVVGIKQGYLIPPCVNLRLALVGSIAMLSLPQK